MFHSWMNPSDLCLSPSKIVGCYPDSLSCGRAGFPPPPAGFPGFPPPPPGFPPPRFPLPGGPKGLLRGSSLPCPPPPPGGSFPPIVVFPVEDPMGNVVGGCTCVVVCVDVAMKMLDQIFLGCRFVGVGMASAICCSSVSSLVFP